MFCSFEKSPRILRWFCRGGWWWFSFWFFGLCGGKVRKGVVLGFNTAEIDGEVLWKLVMNEHLELDVWSSVPQKWSLE